MTQIQCQNGELFGLGEDGCVYIFRPQRAPEIRSEPIPMPYPSIEEQMMRAKEREHMQQIAAQTNCAGSLDCRWYYEDTPHGIGAIMHDPRCEPVEPLRNYIHNPGMAIHQCEVKWQSHFYDGCTAGWEPLPMGISKAVPHPEDPTRNERS